MNVVTVLSDFFGALLVLVGLSALNFRHSHAAFDELVNHKGLLWLTGLLTFLFGVVSLSLFRAWPSDWRVVLTVIGWLTLIKGAVMVLAPNTLRKFYRKIHSSGYAFAGAFALALGLVLLYYGNL